MSIKISDELFSYAVDIRRKIHMYPEIGFELERTVSLVVSELEKIGLKPTTKYGKGSVVAEVGSGEKMIALRADMDALPIDEKTDLPYKSKIQGRMHSCGHDSHTAVLLAVARYLKGNEDKLKCRVRLIFQPSEECAVSGAKMMVDNGVCEGVDHIICTHCENDIPTGTIGIKTGDFMAACVPATIRFIGKSAHATTPQFGIDANAMAIDAYRKMKETVKKEAGDIPHIWAVGRIAGGHVHNIISDACEMDVSFRFYDMDFALRIENKVKEICRNVADEYGGKVEFSWNMSTGPVCNDAGIVEKFAKLLNKNDIPTETIRPHMGSEDFGWYLTKVPGMLFLFGTYDEKSGCRTVAHNNDFCIDEEGMKVAIEAFCEYVMNC